MNEPEIVRLKNAVDERDHAVGSQTAPVTLLEYGNFQCIHCGRAFPVIKEIQRLLGADLCFVVRNFPTVRTHPRAIRAAEAAESAAAQGKFWEMHDELFTTNRRWRTVTFCATQNESDSMLKDSRAIWLKTPFSKIYINEVRYTDTPMSIACCWRSSKRIPKVVSEFLNARKVSGACLTGSYVVEEIV